jgi:uncharacterized membrane protein
MRHFFLWFSIFVICTFIFHIGFILYMPSLTDRNTAPAVQENNAIANAAAHNVFLSQQYKDPFIFDHICEFDLSESPFLVSSNPQSSGWSVSIHTPDKLVLTSLNDRISQEGLLKLLIVAPDNLQEMSRSRVLLPDDIVVVESNTLMGFVHLKSFVPFRSGHKAARIALSETVCEPYDVQQAPVEEIQDVNNVERPLAAPLPPTR